MILESLILCTLTNIWAIRGQSITEGPRNTALNFGESATLYCKADLNGDILEWSRFWNGTYELIWSSEDGNILDDRFSIDVDNGAGTYNLMLLNAEPDLGGQYFVQLVNRKARHDCEVVVLSGLGCLPDTVHAIEEGSDILVQCASSYYGYRPPTITVYHGDRMLSSHDIITEDHINAISAFPATPEYNGTQYRCELAFQVNENDTSPPLKQDGCTTGIFKVYYGPRNMTIKPEVTEVRQGDHFNCSAESYPSCQFKWYCQERTYLQIGNILMIDENLLGEQVCICNAYTTIFGQNRENETEVTFMAAPAEGGDPGGNVPVAVIATLVSVAAIACGAVCIVFLIKTKRMRDKNKV